jgi:hypothetical protein
MISDDLAINRFNPYTWSGTYGVPSDGSKWQSDGTYTVEIDERPTVYTDSNSDLKDFNPIHVMRSGPMYLEEMPGQPAAPFNGFPARKYEFDNGVVTWNRPDLARGTRGEYAFQAPRAKTWDLWVVLAALLIAVLIYMRMRR